MKKYKRYVDDSNQVAVVPPPGARYDANTKTVVHEEVNQVEDEADDSRLARILREIANDVQPGIVMEEDNPSKHPDGKMPILDMKVSSTEEGFISTPFASAQHSSGSKVTSLTLVSSPRPQGSDYLRDSWGLDPKSFGMVVPPAGPAGWEATRVKQGPPTHK